jgi:hypothetical protein
MKDLDGFDFDGFDEFLKIRKERTVSYLKNKGFDARLDLVAESINLYAINIYFNTITSYSIGLVSETEVDLLCYLSVPLADVDISTLLAHKLMDDIDFLKVYVTYSSKLKSHTINFRVFLGEYDDNHIVSGVEILSHSIERYLKEVKEIWHMGRDEILDTD